MNQIELKFKEKGVGNVALVTLLCFVLTI